MKAIGELIGWVPCGPYGWMPPDCDGSDGSPPNVDDLLAWLRGHGLVSIGAQDDTLRSTLPPGYWVEMRILTGTTSFIAPTLLAACEAAVRSIAAQFV